MSNIGRSFTGPYDADAVRPQKPPLAKKNSNTKPRVQKAERTRLRAQSGVGRGTEGEANAGPTQDSLSTETCPFGPRADLAKSPAQRKRAKRSESRPNGRGSARSPEWAERQKTKPTPVPRRIL